MSQFLHRAIFCASSAARLLAGAALLGLLAACAPGGNAVTTGAVGDDSDGSVLIVSTFAGKPRVPGNADGKGDEALFYEPTGITVDNFGNVYVGDVANQLVRKITPAGQVTTLATQENFDFITGLATDVFGNVFVANTEFHNIKKIDALGNVTHVAGSESGLGGSEDGTRTTARFSAPLGLAVAQDGTVYVSDFYGIRSISAQGTVTTIVRSTGADRIPALALDSIGNLYYKLSLDSVYKLAKGANEATRLGSSPDTVFLGFNFAVDKNTNTFIANRHGIEKISADGTRSLFAGSVSDQGHRDGLLPQALFHAFYGSGIAIAPDGTMYISDSNNHVIRKISKGFYVGGVVRGLSGSGKVNLQNNGGATQSITQNGSFTFSMPVAQSATYTAKILSAEGHNCTISNPTGQVTTTVSSIVVDCTPFVQPPQYSAGGVVSGLLSGQTVILRNGADKTVPLGNGTYTFLVKAPNATPYNVVVDQQPVGRICTVANFNNTINNANVTNVNVNCITSTHSISGVASGLGGGTVGLVINNSPTQIISANGRFTLTSAINYGSSFDVNITSQPAGQTCAFSGLAAIASSGSRVTGTVAGDVNVNLNCSTNTYTVTAAVTGTSGAETVSLQMTGNPSGTQTLLLTGAASGTFTNRVPHGATVGLSVLSSPAGKTCSVTSPISVNVTGVSNVTVNCTVNAPVNYTVGGTVSGVPAMTNIFLMMASSDVAANGQSSGGLTDGAYQFTTAVTSGSNFSIATTSPAGYSCTVAAPYAMGTVITGTVTNANVTCVSTGGGGGGGGFTPGTVNGQVTNNGPDTRTILVENGVNQVAVVVNSNSSANFTIPGQLAEGVSYTVTASDVTMPTPGSGLLNCGVNNGTGNMVALPGAVSNVSVTCQLTLP